MCCEHAFRLVQEPVCRRCGKPVLKAEQEFCYDCEKEGAHHYKEGSALWLYDGVMRKSIVAFKYGGRREYAEYYTGQLCLYKKSFIGRVNPDLLIPVPLHKSREKRRGFNQAGLLARGVGKAFGIPVEEGVLIRSKKTAAQKRLEPAERKRNLAQAFAVTGTEKHPVAGKRILLVDDIYTTGSTIEACAAALQGAGADGVYFLTLCIGRGF